MHRLFSRVIFAFQSGVCWLLRREWLVAGIGLAVIAWCVALPTPGRHEWNGVNVQRQVGALLRGQGSLGDVVADIVGLRGMWYRTEAYPILGPAMKAYGENWDIQHRSTHTPFCHVLVAPFSFFSYSVAQTVWGISMLVFTAVALRCLGASTLQAIGFTGILLLWTPFVASLFNIVIVWFLGTCMAYGFRNVRPFRSGLLIGIAASTKYLPVVLVAPFLMRGKWRFVAGVIAACVGLGLIGYLIDPTVYAQYLAVSKEAADQTIQRADNAGFLAAAYNHFGGVGLAAASVFLIGLIPANWPYLWVWRKDAPVDERSFWLMAFFSVALLPISWISSFVVLLPVIAYLFLQRNALSVALATTSAVLLQVLPPFGDFRLAYVTLCVGAAFYLPPSKAIAR